MEKLTDGAIARNQVNTVLAGGTSYSQVRKQLSLDDLAKREADPRTGCPTSLRSLFDYWQSRRVGDVASSTAFDPKDAFTPEEFQWVSWVDVRHSDPMDFVFQAHPGYLFGNWSGKSIRDYPNAIHARSVALEYLTCKMIQQPSYYEISQTIGQVSRTYMRLLLPVQGRRKPLSRLYYATRYVSISVDGEPVTGGTPQHRPSS